MNHWIIFSNIALIILNAHNVEMTLFNLLKRGGKPSKQSFHSITTKFHQQCVSVCGTNTNCHSYTVEKSQINDQLMECHFYDTSSSTDELTTADGVQYHIQMRDCKDWYNVGARASGVYQVNWLGRIMMNVRCNMEVDGGGWIVFQRQFYPLLEFNRIWTAFKSGFGDVSGQFWLGNDLIHEMTTSKNHYVLMYARMVDGTEVISKYGSFYIENESELYRMHFNETLLEGVHSFFDTKDNLKNSNGMAFTTIDNDNDLNPKKNCAVTFTGAGWPQRCSPINFATENLRWDQSGRNTADMREMSIMIKAM